MSGALIDILIAASFGQLINCLFMKVIVDGQHLHGRLAFGSAVLLDDLNHFRMERSLVAILLSG